MGLPINQGESVKSPVTCNGGIVGLKIVMRDYEKSQEEIRLHAIRLMLRETANPNLPMIPGAEDALFRQRCYECGTVTWQPQGHSFCEECWSLTLAENELNRQLGRKEREVRLREAEKQLAELG